MPGRDIGPKIVNNDAGVPLNVLTTAADDYSEAINPAGARRLHWFCTTAGSSGTSPTLDVKFEVSFDGGTTWDPMPISANSATQAALTQITGNASENEWHECAFAKGSGVRVRAHLDLGGTSPSFNITLRVMRQG